MSDTEPGGVASGPLGPPARPPGPVPAGYLPSEWAQHAPPPTAPPSPPRPPYPADQGGSYAMPLPAGGPISPPPPPAVALGDAPFLDTPWVPPQTKRQGWMWLVYAIVGFLVGQLAAEIFGLIAGAIAGKTTAQMQAIATASVPPEWYVVSTLLGLWIGFIGAPWLASRTQGTRNFVRDLGLRFRWWDLLGILIGFGGQILIGIMYAPFQHDIHNFNGPSQRLTGASHGAGFVVIAIATVLLRAGHGGALLPRAVTQGSRPSDDAAARPPAARGPPESSWPSSSTGCSSAWPTASGSSWPASPSSASSSPSSRIGRDASG